MLFLRRSSRTMSTSCDENAIDSMSLIGRLDASFRLSSDPNHRISAAENKLLKQTLYPRPECLDNEKIASQMKKCPWSLESYISAF